ncbi:MAG: LytTR family transcriptional regulator [Chitinophagaceae bacterium]|nr:LytTR family transcriptional regulator [Chitinophagaceae bacterium]
MLLQPYFFVRCNGRYEKVRFSELILVKAMRGYMRVVTEQKTYLVLNRMETVQQYLPKELFCRIHRSYIVSLERVRAFDNFKVWLYPPPDGQTFRPGLARLQELPLGKNFRKAIRDSVAIMPNRAGVFKSVLDEAAFILEGEEMEE